MMKFLMKPYIVVLLMVGVLGSAMFLLILRTDSKNTSVDAIGITPTQVFDVSSTLPIEKLHHEMLASEIGLTITSPKDGTVVTSQEIVVKGKTVSGAELFINDQAYSAGASGNFAESVTLSEGKNIILVVSHDENGKYAEKMISVYYEE